MTKGIWLSICSIALLVWSRPVLAVIPGGVYGRDEAMTLSIDAWPKSLGYHVVRGTVSYHGRMLPFASGVFLPPAFFHTNDPLPVLMALHNRYAIGSNGGFEIIGEGMGRILGRGGDDERRVGEMAPNPIVLRRDAGFIGVVPQCPAGFVGWEDPHVARIMFNFLDQVVAHYHADGDRQYLTGFSYERIVHLAHGIACAGSVRSHHLLRRAGHADPIRDVEKLKNVGVYLEVGQWDGDFVAENDRMHRALNTLPHRNYMFRMVDNGNHFCYEAVYDDPEVWKWVFAQRRSTPAKQTAAGE